MENEENILEEWARGRVINLMCRVSELKFGFEEKENDYPETFSYEDFKSILNEICIQIQMLYSLLRHCPYVVNGEARKATDPDIVFFPFAGIFMIASGKRKAKKSDNSAQMQKAYETGYRDACKMQFYLENRDALKADIEKMINESINEKYAKGILMTQEEMLDRFNLGGNNYVETEL